MKHVRNTHTLVFTHSFAFVKFVQSIHPISSIQSLYRCYFLHFVFIVQILHVFFYQLRYSIFSYLFCSFLLFHFLVSVSQKECNRNLLKLQKKFRMKKKVNEFQINEKLKSRVEQKRNAFSCIFIANSQVSLIQRKKCMSLLAAPFFRIFFSSNSILILLFNSLNYLKIILSHSPNLWFSYSMYDNKKKKKR